MYDTFNCSDQSQRGRCCPRQHQTGFEVREGHKASNGFIKSFSLVAHKLIDSAIAKVGNQHAKAAKQQHNVHILEELQSWRIPW